jgi:hydroxyacylglutathione hydrolase
MNIESICVGPLQANCYIIWDTSRHAIVIDPGDESKRIIDLITKRDLQVKAYLATHGHQDHINAVAEMIDTLPAPVKMHPLDLKWAFRKQNQLPMYSAIKKPNADFILLTDQQILSDAEMQYLILFTPGHSPGSVCFYFQKEEKLFSGDTIFKGSAGRTDIQGADGYQLKESLKKIKQLPDKVTIYPGHGPKTTIKQEKETNPFLQNIVL